jgi:hypothetical protein
MNERYKRLAEQARIGLHDAKQHGFTVVSCTDSHLNEYTELVIREVIREIEQYELDSRNHISECIKQEFGIK